MRPDLVMVVPPSREHGLRFGQGRKERPVQAFVPEPADETLGEGILLRLAGGDVMPFDLAVPAPAEDRHGGELGAVVRYADPRLTTPGGDGIQLAGDPGAG